MSETKATNIKIFENWNRKAWLWVLLYAFLIFFTIPVSRKIQGFIYNLFGREFFTYSVIFVVICGLAVFLYFFIFKLKIKNISQYVWIFICAGLYIYFTIQLRRFPEEATHLIEYGLLSYFVFKALSHRIQDWTVYITTILIVSFIGTIDEGIQWMTPKRYWDFRDVGINMLGGVILQLTIWKGIKPDVISRPLKKLSVKILIIVFSIDLIVLGLCLSNTPQAVNRYTAVFQSLSWLRAEEPMSKFAFLKTMWVLILISLITIWVLSARWLKRLK
ncbi:MAG: VanZ family protein [Nitrospirae bacterium]|nr:VanZ family protein [Nitrospirota bacterium]